jgi:hypothetical protein
MAKHRYKVIGTQPVHGTPPGGSFEADLPEDQEAFLKQIGAIRSVGGPAPKNEDASVEKVAGELADEQEEAKRAPDVES